MFSGASKENIGKKRFNQLFQRDESTIHILRASMERLAKTLAKHVVKSEILKV